jgi:hypothetical protein
VFKTFSDWRGQHSPDPKANAVVLNNILSAYCSRLEISHHAHHRHYQDGDEGEHCSQPDLKPRTGLLQG